MSGSSSSNIANSLFGNLSNNSRSGQSQFGQNVFQPQSNALNNAYDQAGNVYHQMQGQQSDAINYANQQAQGAGSANLNNMQGGAYGGLNIGNQLMSSLNQSQNTPSNMQQINSMIMGGNGNTSLDALKGSLEANAARSNNLNQGTNAAQAAASGMSGGSRQGVMDALNQNDTNRNLQNTEAQLGYNSFNSDLDRKLNIAQQADANTFNRQNLMSNMLGQQQNTINQGIGNTGNVQGYGTGGINNGWSSLNDYMQALGRPTVLNSGTSSNQGQGSSTGWGYGNSSGSSKGGGVL